MTQNTVELNINEDEEIMIADISSKRDLEDAFFFLLSCNLYQVGYTKEEAQRAFDNALGRLFI